MILESLRQKMLAAQKTNDIHTLGVLRFLFAALKNKEIELRPQKLELTDEEALKVLKKQIKQRNDSIESYKTGNRQDLVDKETKEREVLETLLNEYAHE